VNVFIKIQEFLLFCSESLIILKFSSVYFVFGSCVHLFCYVLATWNIWALQENVKDGYSSILLGNTTIGEHQL